MTAPAMPGQPVAIPVPPDLGPALGYPGNARYIVLCHEEDHVSVIDGRGIVQGNHWAYQAYRRHRVVEGLLRPFDLTSPDSELCLVFDLQGCRASVATGAEAAEFLKKVRPPAMPITAEQIAQAEALDALGWREEPVDQAEVMRAMQERRGRVSRMMSWLDMCPTPEEGRGA